MFLVAENAQYWPEIVQTQEIIESGTIGDVITARAWHCAAPMEEFHHEGHWRLSLDEAGGGVAVDAGSRWLRPLRMWLGELVDVVAVTGRPYAAIEEVVAPGPVRFIPGWWPASTSCCRPVRWPRSLCSSHRERGRSSIDGLGQMTLYDRSRTTVRGGQPGRLSPELRHQMACFEAAVLDGVAAPVDAAFSLGESRGALAIDRSPQSRRLESVSSRRRSTTRVHYPRHRWLQPHRSRGDHGLPSAWSHATVAGHAPRPTTTTTT